MGTISSGIKSKINYLTRAIKQGRILSVYDLMLIRSEFIQLEHNYTLLEKRLSWCREERNHFVRVINEAIRICIEGDKRIAKLEAKLKDATLDGDMFSKGWDKALAKNREWEASFKLYDDAMRRGTKMWQEATGKVRIWPDAAQLVAWLLHQDALLVEELAEYKEDLDLHKKIRNAQADMITNLMKKLAERNATLDQIDALTKIIEIKVENLQRSSDLLVEQNKKLRTENETLRETLIQREMAWGGWTRQVAEIVVGLLTNAGEKSS